MKGLFGGLFLCFICSMKLRIAINGFGRIGRKVLKELLQHQDEVEVVAINDLSDAKTLAHLLKYDSVHGRFRADVKHSDNSIAIDGHVIHLYNEKGPELLPWSDLKIDYVLECTGKFKTEELAGKHLVAGAKKVVLSAPPQDSSIQTVVLGVNDNLLTGDELIVSNASCTTNSAAPLVQEIQKLSKIETGYITTVHSYTTDQKLHDAPHHDLRRARAAALSIVPTTTGAAKALTKVFPELDGKLGGCGIRVPVPDGSLTDMTFIVEDDLTIDQINGHFKKAAETNLKGILSYTDDPIVSVDIVGETHSSLFDAQLTSVIGKMVKVVAWYDNEAGYSARLVDLLFKMNDLSSK